MQFQFEIEKEYALELLARQTESISPRSGKALCRKNPENVNLCQKYKVIHCKKGTDEHRRLQTQKKNPWRTDKKNRSIKPSPTHLSSVPKESYFFTISGHWNAQSSSFFTSKPKFVSCFQDNLSYLQKGLCNIASRRLFLAFIGWSTKYNCLGMVQFIKRLSYVI